MVDRSTPLKDTLGESWGTLTSLQQSLVDFADKMHQRLKQFNADDDIELVVEENSENGPKNIGRLLSNVSQLAKADAQSVYSQTAAVDTANLAFILDAVHASKFLT